MQNQNNGLDQPAVQEEYIGVENGEIYTRESGQGQPVIVLHGGPDFNHSYFFSKNEARRQP